MTPSYNNDKVSLTRLQQLARSLDWWERFLAVAVIPFALWLATDVGPRAASWVGSVESRLQSLHADDVALQHEDALSREQRAQIMAKLDKLLDQQILILQELAALKAQGKPR